MALTIIIIMSFIAASVNGGGFVWQNNDNFAENNFKFQKYVPKFTQFPYFPTFSQFSPRTPSFRKMPPISFLTPEDIVKKSGPNYNAVSVSSSSSSMVDENGKVIKTGGTTIVTSADGVVKKYSKPINQKKKNFIGTSSVSFFRTSDVNGVKTSTGDSNLVSNVNGDVAEKIALFGENKA
ncbi:unnamed protein product [Euphydryas editha]|uniref:Seroin transcript 1A n=1 Tax=Euphydryas editha TaxID=104508 RepID=A0AAU9UYC3_EUPED|nr:unnamed protein product [Euphydryas editha]